MRCRSDEGVHDDRGEEAERDDHEGEDPIPTSIGRGTSLTSLYSGRTGPMNIEWNTFTKEARVRILTTMAITERTGLKANTDSYIISFEA